MRIYFFLPFDRGAPPLISLAMSFSVTVLSFPETAGKNAYASSARMWQTMAATIIAMGFCTTGAGRSLWQSEDWTQLGPNSLHCTPHESKQPMQATRRTTACRNHTTLEAQ